MTDIKSQILAEVEESLGSHAVMVVADAMEKCPTLVAMIDNSSVIADGVSTGFVIPPKEAHEEFDRIMTEEEFIRRVDESLKCDCHCTKSAELRSLEDEVFIKGDE